MLRRVEDEGAAGHAPELVHVRPPLRPTPLLLVLVEQELDVVAARACADDQRQPVRLRVGEARAEDGHDREAVRRACVCVCVVFKS